MLLGFNCVQCQCKYLCSNLFADYTIIRRLMPPFIEHVFGNVGLPNPHVAMICSLGCNVGSSVTDCQLVIGFLVMAIRSSEIQILI